MVATERSVSPADGANEWFGASPEEASDQYGPNRRDRPIGRPARHGRPERDGLQKANAKALSEEAA
jgi:hypothetical protein